MPSRVEREVREILLDLGDEQAWAKLEGIFGEMDERDRRISETLDALLQEVEELILLSDEFEAGSFDG
jgi:hypothetical protein